MLSVPVLAADMVSPARHHVLALHLDNDAADDAGTEQFVSRQFGDDIAQKLVALAEVNGTRGVRDALAALPTLRPDQTSK